MPVRWFQLFIIPPLTLFALLTTHPVFAGTKEKLACIASLESGNLREQEIAGFRAHRLHYARSEVAVTGYRAGEQNDFFGHVIGEYTILTVSHAIENNAGWLYLATVNEMRLYAEVAAYNETLRLALLKTTQSLYAVGATRMIFDRTVPDVCRLVFMLAEEGRETGITYPPLSPSAPSPIEHIPPLEDFEEIIRGLTLRFSEGMSGQGVYTARGLTGIFDRYAIDGSEGTYIPLFIIDLFLTRYQNAIS